MSTIICHECGLPIRFRNDLVAATGVGIMVRPMHRECFDRYDLRLRGYVYPVWRLSGRAGTAASVTIAIFAIASGAITLVALTQKAFDFGMSELVELFFWILGIFLPLYGIWQVVLRLFVRYRYEKKLP